MIKIWEVFRNSLIRNSNITLNFSLLIKLINMDILKQILIVILLVLQDNTIKRVIIIIIL